MGGGDQVSNNFLIEGLKEEIMHTIKMLDPFFLSQDVEKARHKEEMIDSMNKNIMGGARQSGHYSSNNNGLGSRSSSLSRMRVTVT